MLVTNRPCRSAQKIRLKKSDFDYPKSVSSGYGTHLTCKGHLLWCSHSDSLSRAQASLVCSVLSLQAIAQKPLTPSQKDCNIPSAIAAVRVWQHLPAMAGALTRTGSGQLDAQTVGASFPLHGLGAHHPRAPVHRPLALQRVGPYLALLHFQRPSQASGG